METTITDRRPEWLKRLHEWRVAHVSEKMFMIILALLIGFFAAVAAFSLHWIINQIVSLLTSSFDRTGANWLPVLDAEKRLKGYISRQRIYTVYRKMVADMSED